jgi:hypothetical protein
MLREKRKQLMVWKNNGRNKIALPNNIKLNDY